jgi:hypothetical protein
MKKQIFVLVGVSMAISQFAWAGFTGQQKMRDLDSGSYKCEFDRRLKRVDQRSSFASESSHASGSVSKSAAAR